MLFIIPLLLQVLIFDKAIFSKYTNAYIYILFILLLPANFNKHISLILAFLLGFSVDIFNSTPGIHASATIFMTYFRPFILRIYAPHDDYEINKPPGIINYGFNWFLKYSLSLIFLHHSFLFIIDTWSFINFGDTLLKIILSAFSSLFFIILGHLLIMKE